MAVNEEMSIQLWEYIDGTCSEADRLRITQLLSQDAVLHREYEKLVALHTNLHTGIELEQPSLRFVKDTMDMIAATHMAPAAKRYINRNIIKGIAAFFLIAIGSIFIYALATTNWNAEGPDMLHRLSMKSITLPNINGSALINIIIAINVFLALVFIDILLRRKRAASGHH